VFVTIVAIKQTGKLLNNEQFKKVALVLNFNTGPDKRERELGGRPRVSAEKKQNPGLLLIHLLLRI
jgi:hypothetical protein